MALSIIAICDVCAAARFEVPFSDSTGMGEIPPEWARVEVTLASRVIPPEYDNIAAAVNNLPARLREYSAALIKQQTRPFCTVLHVCPTCRETMGVVNTIVAARLREREYVDTMAAELDGASPLPFVPRPVE